MALQSVGGFGWVYHLHRKSGARTWSEISSEILAADHVVIICTASSAASEGQLDEINLAMNEHKEILIVTGNAQHRPPPVRGRNYDDLQLGPGPICEKWRKEWEIDKPRAAEVKGELDEIRTLQS